MAIGNSDRVDGSAEKHEALRVSGESVGPPPDPSWKSSLFFVRDGLPGIGLPGDRDVVPVKHRGSCDVRGTSVDP